MKRQSAILLYAIAVTGCLSEVPYGTIAPTRQICKLGAFRQELALAKDFRIDRQGDDEYPADAIIRAGVAGDARAVAAYSKCPNQGEVGVFHMVIKRVEAGSSRSVAMKIAMWTLFLVPTLGLSSIYPLTEERWLTIELDADATIGNKAVWTGQFTSFTRAPLMAPKEFPTTGSQLTALVLRAQDAAVKDLKTALEIP